MRAIFIAARLFDTEGAFAFPVTGKTELAETRRRVSRSATLDGGVAVNDFGSSHGDKKVTVYWRPTSPAFEAKVAALVDNHTQVYVSTEDGVFLAAPEYYKPTPSESRLSLLFIEKVSN